MGYVHRIKPWHFDLSLLAWGIGKEQGKNWSSKHLPQCQHHQHPLELPQTACGAKDQRSPNAMFVVLSLGREWQLSSPSLPVHRTVAPITPENIWESLNEVELLFPISTPQRKIGQSKLWDSNNTITPLLIREMRVQTFLSCLECWLSNAF